MAVVEPFHKRIGAVFLPEPDTIPTEDDPSSLQSASPCADSAAADAPPTLTATSASSISRQAGLFPRLCAVSLKQGCYTIAFTPAGTSILGTRFRGTMRVERTGSGVRISADLYRYRLLDDIVVKPLPVHLLGDTVEHGIPSDEAADSGGSIPIYRRSAYQSYLKGTGAALLSFRQPGSPCPFTLSFDEFVYNQPASGFNGTFNASPTRSIRWELATTATADLYTGSAFQGTTNLGTVSMRWVADSFRRAEIVLHTLNGAASPPADVGGTTMPSIYADVGWDVTFVDGGAISLPPALSGVTITNCWADANLHALMASVPGYAPADLDSVWRVELVAVPAKLGCGRGIMFDTGGGDPNGIAREGSATFSDDGYPSSESSCYGTAANKKQRDVPRAFLRSATHETGHAFNQIHQNFEGGADNSIMSPTNSVANVLCPSGFPNSINLAFNDRVKKHLRHLPDPAVRPGAMDFFGAAVSSPEPADVAWLDGLELTVTPSSTRVALGEPITLTWELKNTGSAPIPAPKTLDVESLVMRVSVTDPTGEITFMRPPEIESCPRIWIEPLEPGASVTGGTTLFWGTDGFAFEHPGRHMIEAIALWDIGGAPTAVSGQVWVFVRYPASENDNDVAALLLHPDVGRAVALGDAERFDVASARIAKAVSVDESNPATAALRDLGLAEEKAAPAG
jgi:hypothetical protein